VGSSTTLPSTASVSPSFCHTALVLGAEKSPRPETHLMLRELGGTRTEKSGVTRPLPSQDPVMAQRSVNSVLGSKVRGRAWAL
jgi:hypothetical protein